MYHYQIEWHTKENMGKSMRNTFCVLQNAKSISLAEVMSNREKLSL